MPGVFITNMYNGYNEFELRNISNIKTYCEEMKSASFLIKRNSLDSFKNDKVFYEDKKYIIITEGVILNSSEIIKRYCADNLISAIIKMLDTNKSFFSEFRGTFSGAIYDKEKQEWIVFTDQLGSHAIYYYHKNGDFIIGSQLNYIVDYMKLNSIDVSEDLHGVGCLLDWGYLIDSATVVKDVKRLYPGEFLKIYNNEIKVDSYYMPNYKQEKIGIDEAVSRLDIAFSNAVSRVINKNKEYGYKTLIDISGGLDSRMIAFKAVDLFGESDLLGISFSKSSSIEQEIAVEVAKELNISFISKILDTDNFIRNVEDNMFMNNGSSYYTGLLCGKNFSEIIDNRVFGIELTGLMGDMNESSMISECGLDKPNLLNERYRTSRKFDLNEFSNYSSVTDKFKTNEAFWLYTRGVMAGMNTVLSRQSYIELITPYGDVEFLEVYLSIPWKMRVENKVLLQWMKKKYPKAVNIKYSATLLPAKLTGSFKQRAITSLLKRINEIFHKDKVKMAPIDLWLNKNISFLDEYYQKNIELINCSEKIRKKISVLYNSDNEIDKIVALSVIASYKIYLFD